MAVAPPPPNLEHALSDGTRRSILDEIHDLKSQVRQLNHQIEHGYVLDANENVEVIRRIRDLYTGIKQTQENATKNVTIWCISENTWKKIGVAVGGLATAATCANVVSSGVNTVQQNQLTAQVPRSVIGTGTAAFALALATFVAGGIYNHLNTKRQERLKPLVDPLLQETNIALLLGVAYKSIGVVIEHKQQAAAAAETNIRVPIRECIGHFQKIPNTTLTNDRIRDRWVSLLASQIPEAQRRMSENIRISQMRIPGPPIPESATLSHFSAPLPEKPPIPPQDSNSSHMSQITTPGRGSPLSLPLQSIATVPSQLELKNNGEERTSSKDSDSPNESPRNTKPLIDSTRADMAPLLPPGSAAAQPTKPLESMTSDELQLKFHDNCEYLQRELGISNFKTLFTKDELAGEGGHID